MIEVTERYFVHTPLGLAEVWYIRDDDLVEHTCQVGVFQEETKELWFWPNSQVRLAGSVSAMRDDKHSDIYLSAERFEFLAAHIRRHTKSPFYWRVNDRTNHSIRAETKPEAQKP